VAIGVLMELRGWDATKARFRLTEAALRTDSEVDSVAQAILALYP
jgi:AmiR/NasT family two-component response regulator